MLDTHRLHVIWILLVFFVVGPSRAADDLSPLSASCLEQTRKLVIPADADAVAPLENVPHLRRQALARDVFRHIPSALSYSSEPAPFITTRAKVLTDPQQGLLAKVLMIRNAKHTIDLTTFIFANDESGKILLHELALARQRGVSIRLMVDSMGSLKPYHSELRALFQAKPGNMKDREGRDLGIPATLEIRTINTLWNLKRFGTHWIRRFENIFLPPEAQWVAGNRLRNRRSHDKLLIADADYGDQAMAILGGRNVSNAYYGIPDYDAKTYHDMEVLLRPGGTEEEIEEFARSIRGHYERVFYHSGNRTVREGPSWLSFLATGQAEKARKAHENILSREHPVGQKLARMEAENFLESDLTEASGLFVHQVENLLRENALRDPDGPATKPNGASLSRAFVDMVKNAKTSIDIVSPYLYLYPDELAALREWLVADPSRRLRVITNSLYSADNIAAQALTDRELGPNFTKFFGDLGGRAQLLTYGRIDADDLGGTEYYGKVHAKFSVIDGNQSLVGSSNGDPRSRYLNSELGEVLLSEKIAQDLLKEIEVLANGSYEFGTPEWHKLREHPKLRRKLMLQKGAYPIIKRLKLRGMI